MIMKSLFHTHAKTLEEYRRTLRLREGCFWGLALLGAATLGVTLLLMRGSIADESDAAYLQGVWCGIGTGLIVAGVLFALRTRRMLSQDEAALRSALREEQDERNLAIIQRSLGTAAGVGFILLYLALLAFSFIDLTVFHTLCCCAVVFAALFFAAKTFYSRRM